MTDHADRATLQSSTLVTTPTGTVPRRARVIGVDAARGLALLGMFAVHVAGSLRSDKTPSHTQEFVAGHSLATFVLLAGVSVAFMTGRTGPASWRRPSTGVAASLAVRAVLIALIGLSLNLMNPDVEVILPYYGVMFLLAIPLVGLTSRALVITSAVLVVVAPLVVFASFATDLPTDEPSLTSLVHPVALAAPLLVTGSYPAVEYMAFICLGMAFGRLDLSSTKVAARLAAGGAALAATAWVASSYLLFDLGGLTHLRDAAPSGLTAHQTRNVILWDPDTSDSWWWLAQRAPYTATPLRMLHDLGVAAAVLGCCLLVTRLRVLRRPLWPLVAAGSMSLTLYTAQILVLQTGVLGDHTITLFVVLSVGAMAFAVLWRRRRAHGPLEGAIARCCGWARRRLEPAPDRC